MHKEKKSLQLLTALAPEEQLYVRERSFHQAVQILKNRIESLEALTALVQTQFKAIDKAEYPRDLETYKAISKTLSSVFARNAEGVCIWYYQKKILF